MESEARARESPVDLAVTSESPPFQLHPISVYIIDVKEPSLGSEAALVSRGPWLQGAYSLVVETSDNRDQLPKS